MRMTNEALAGRPADMTVTMHLCRGNFRSTWISSGGYEPVAETMLAGTNYDGYFLEYDSDRAGGFEPLRYLPKGNKVVVVGVITSKFGELEKKDDIKRRIEEATKFAPIDQFCLSPQCGFASTEEGNVLAEEEEWAKLRMIIDLAFTTDLDLPMAPHDLATQPWDRQEVHTLFDGLEFRVLRDRLFDNARFFRDQMTGLGFTLQPMTSQIAPVAAAASDLETQTTTRPCQSPMTCTNADNSG